MKIGLDTVDASAGWKDVVSSCFSWTLEPDYECEIEKFRAKYVTLPEEYAIVTLKFHVLFCHVSEWCKVSKRGLGMVSEQALETLHSKFATANQHKIKNPDSEKWSANSLRSVLEWNAMSCVP